MLVIPSEDDEHVKDIRLVLPLDFSRMHNRFLTLMLTDWKKEIQKNRLEDMLFGDIQQAESLQKLDPERYGCSILFSNELPEPSGCCQLAPVVQRNSLKIRNDPLLLLGFP